jgi:uncharacterized protein (TIGR03086 family)
MTETTIPTTAIAADPRVLFGRASAVSLAVIAGVRPDQHGDPTPCAGYDVHDLLGHLVLCLNKMTVLGRGGSWFTVPPVDEVPGGDFGAASRTAVDELQAAWADDATLVGPYRLPWGELTGAQLFAGYTNEMVVHAWDLAAATGQRPEWDDEVLTVAFDEMRRNLPAGGRAEAGAPFADAVPVPDDAPLIERLVAWNGRQP